MELLQGLLALLAEVLAAVLVAVPMKALNRLHIKLEAVRLAEVMDILAAVVLLHLAETMVAVHVAIYLKKMKDLVFKRQ